jgi:hypothetical protein
MTLVDLKGNLVAGIARRVVAALAIGTLFVVGAFTFAPSTAGAQGLDLCDLLGDPYCPDVDPGNITCSDGAPIGGTGSCEIGGVAVGDEVTATLTCGDFSAVVFEGTVTEVPFSFSFDVPSNAPAGAGSVTVAGATFPFECGGGALARTGSDVAPMLAIGGGLVAIGLAAAFGARRRIRTVQPA